MKLRARQPGCGGERAFTLVELMVVVAIVTLLLTLAMPGYQGQLLKTRRSLAVTRLLQLAMRQEEYFVEYKRYAQDVVELGLPASPYAIDSEGEFVSAEAGSRIYLIELRTGRGGYTLQARPLLAQSSDKLCGTLSIEVTGVKAAAGPGGAEECW